MPKPFRQICMSIVTAALITPLLAQSEHDAGRVATMASLSPANNATSKDHPMTIVADLSDASRKLLHAEIEIPVRTGPFTFTAARWIPGNHSPSGPIGDLTGIAVTANGHTIPWRRDDIDMYAFHVQVPAGVTRLHIHDDFLAVGQGIDVAPNLVELEWERLMLYPAGVPVQQIVVQPSVIVSPNWQLGTALTRITSSGNRTTFARTNIGQLEDSPVLAGRYFREIPLTPAIHPQHFLDVAADSPADLEQNLSPHFLAALNKLVLEAGAMYGPPHYDSYHFLLTLSEYAGRHGQEHQQSSNDGCSRDGYANPAQAELNAELLPHEFTHSWNGKYRRPIGLNTPDFATPMKGELLWVYEGMTRYLGDVLAARSGFETNVHYRNSLAFWAAWQDVNPRRIWRNTEDTAIAASVQGGSIAYIDWRGSQDYYAEGELLWLDVDTTIRKLTGNRKSLHDFSLLFLAKGGATGPITVPYDLNEIVSDLNQVAPNDWAAFLRYRITALTPHANLDGIDQAGWHLVYKDEPGLYEQAFFGRFKAIDAYFSLGLLLANDGTVLEVRFFSPAFTARLAPDEKIVSINGRDFSAESLHSALLETRRGSKNSSVPIHMTVRSGDADREVLIDYHDGNKYPALERSPDTPDVLGEILTPMTP